MASAAACSVEDGVGAPMVCQEDFLALRNSEVRPITLHIVSRSFHRLCHKGMVGSPVRGMSSSALVELFLSQPKTSSSAIETPVETSFRFRFLDLFSGFGSAVR